MLALLSFLAFFIVLLIIYTSISKKETLPAATKTVESEAKTEEESLLTKVEQEVKTEVEKII